MLLVRGGGSCVTPAPACPLVWLPSSAVATESDRSERGLPRRSCSLLPPPAAGLLGAAATSLAANAAAAVIVKLLAAGWSILRWRTSPRTCHPQSP